MYLVEVDEAMYEDAKDRLRGSIAPVVTPFREDGEVDYEALAGLVEYQISNGSHGISVCGTTGEPSSLSLEEREKVMETAIRVAAGRVPVVPGTGSVNQKEALRLTRAAQEMGADAALVIVPYYVQPNQRALYEHFKKVANSVDIPVIIYNIPGRTATDMAPETMHRLQEDCPNIIGCKESSKDFVHANHIMQLCRRGWLLYSGIELLCYPMLAIGGAGYVSATANVAPREVAQLYELWKAGDVEGAIQMHYHLLPLNDVLFRDTNPVPMKAALGMMGRIKPIVRPPLGQPTPELMEEIRKTLTSYGLL